MPDKKKVTKEIWNNFAKIWSVGLVPHRLSDEEIDIYREYIERSTVRLKRKPRVLILGATPETRDLCAEMNIKPDLVDINPNMLRAMTELLEVSNGKEKIIISDWLKMPIKNSQYDVVMCDHGINNIKFREWPKFIKEVKRILKPNGFLIKNIFTVEEHEAIDVEDIAKIIKKREFSQLDKFYYIHRSIPRLKDIKDSKYYKDLSEIKERLINLKKKGKINHNEYEMLVSPELMYSFKLVVPFKEEVDKLFSKHFLVKSVRNGWAHPALTFSKIYYCQNTR